VGPLAAWRIAKGDFLKTSVNRCHTRRSTAEFHDIPMRLPFRVELWDRHDQHIRSVIAAASSVAVGHVALDAAIAYYPDQRFTLRNGIQIIREHVPKSAP
jgi:hypothetical protein